MKKQTIEEACTLHARIGWQGLTKSEYLDTGEYYLVTGVDFSDGLIDFEHCHFVTRDRYDQDEHIQLDIDDVLVTKDGTIGKVAIIDRLNKPATLNSGVFVVRPKDKDKLLPEYLVFALRSGHFSRFIEQIKVGCTIAHLNQAKFLKYEIPEISVDEQRYVIDVLKRAESVVSARKQELQKLDDLIKARFVEMFGNVIHNDKNWKKHTFSDITTSRLGKMLDAKQQTGEYPFPYLGNANVQWFRFDTTNLNQMDFNEADQVEFALEDGDLLVCEGGEIGRCAVWHNQVQPCYFQKAIHRVRCNKQFVLPDYLAWWFKFNCEHNGFSAIEGAKATIAHLPGAKLKQLQVVVPPIDLQKQFVDFITQLDKSKVVVQKALDEAQLLFDSLMQQYFG